MSKSEEIIKDWHDAHELYRSRFKLTPPSITMVEIVQDAIDRIDDLKEEIKYLDRD